MQHFLDTWKFNVRYGGFARYVLFGHFFNEEIMEVKKGNPAAGLPRFAGFERSEVSAVSALHVVFSRCWSFCIVQPVRCTSNTLVKTQELPAQQVCHAVRKKVKSTSK